MRASTILLSLSIVACSASPSRIEVRDAWARETNAATTAIYLTAANNGGTGDRLTGASSATGNASLHVTQSVDGIARMRPVPQSEGLALPAGDELTLRPGGAHIMLTGLRRPLRAGDTIPLTLVFAGSGATPIEVPVRPAGETNHGH